MWVSYRAWASFSVLSADERSLYDMIARRLIAAHYPTYEYEAAKVNTRVGAHDFRSTGAMPLTEGWKALYKNDRPAKGKKGEDAEPPLPRLEAGDERRVEKAAVKAEKTTPPPEHNDASLLKLMENAGQDLEDETLREQLKSSGLGTPATRAATIERLIEVGYARRKGKHIVSTEKGRQLIAVVPEQIASAATTGKWEKFLSDLAAQKDEAERARKSQRFMSGIRKFSLFLVDAAKQGNREVRFEKEAPKKRKPKTAFSTKPRKSAPKKKAQG